MITKIKNPVVILMVDGLGLSSSWQGNAVATANPINFNNYWNNYNHLVLHSKPDLNIFQNYTRISTGINESVNVSIEKSTEESLSQSQELMAAIDTVKRNNAAVNLMGVISKNDSNKSISNLIKTIIFFKKNLVQNIYIHIFIDQTFMSITEIGSALFELDQKLVRFDAQISTICGLESLTDKNLQKNVEAIFNRNAQTFLSSRQCLAKHQKVAHPDQIPLSILEIKGNISINDFDLVYFFSSPTDKFANFIEQLLILNKNHALPRRLMSISFFSYYDYPFNFSDGLGIISRREIENFLPVKITKKGKKHLLVTDSGNIAAMNYYYLGQPSVAEQSVVTIDESVALLSTTREIMSRAIASIKEQAYDLITVNITSLYRAYKSNSFANCVSEISLIDEFLPDFFSSINDGYLLITSAFGGSESMVANTSNISDNRKKKSAFESLPLLLVSNKTEKRTKSDLLHEILSSHEDLTFVHKVLEKLIS
jgi:2,3-bisphosphoglycerate-independent phosphoglycerate mutase